MRCMAGNSFAAKFNSSTKRFIAVLIYAMLEWILISLLLLNSLFSYLIVKFAKHVGLKSPCLWCSRLDHILEPNKKTHSYRDLVCDSHAREISNFGYCLKHGNFVQLQSICEQCLEYPDKEKSVIEARDHVSSSEENGQTSKTCSGRSRNVDISNFKGCNKGNSHDLEEATFGHQEHDHGSSRFRNVEEKSGQRDLYSGDSLAEIGHRCTDLSLEDTVAGDYRGKDESLGLAKLNCQDNFDLDSESLIHTEARDISAAGQPSLCCLNDVDTRRDDHSTGEKNAEKESYWVSFLQKKIEESVCKAFHHGQETYLLQTRAVNLPGSTKNQSSPQDSKNEEGRINCSGDKNISEISRSTLSNQVAIGIKDEEIVPSLPELGVKHEAESTSDKQDFLLDEFKIATNNLVSKQSGLGEVDEEKPPEKPTSIECLNRLKKSLLLEKTESTTDKSWDGSVANEFEGGGGILTNKEPKASIKAEQKALKSLFAELEKERSASAIAVSQTMAMITRLQEEKAQMQMEASQYQRMMEEQSEYDQEALHLLNSQMIKREKEKQELQNELEIYSMKVLEYQAKESTGMVSRDRGEGSKTSASCSEVEDSDHLSLSIDNEVGDENSSDVHCNNTIDEVLNLEEIAVECVKNLTELGQSFAEYDEEKFSILDQLKYLEDKLIAMGANKGFLEITTSDNKPEDSLRVIEETDGSNACDERNQLTRRPSEADFSERKTMCSLAKCLLPLLDTAEEDEKVQLLYKELLTPESTETQNASGTDSALESRKLAIEEVDRVYKKLQSLKADEEFSGHCVGSMSEDEKSMNLLQDILQNLEDLKAVELSARSMASS